MYGTKVNKAYLPTHMATNNGRGKKERKNIVLDYKLPIKVGIDIVRRRRR